MSLEQIMTRIVVQGECLIWQGAVDSSGYSSIWDGERVRGGHRLVYELANGPIPDGLTVDHACFATLCLNPKHLRLLTNEANARRQKSALKTHCIQDHEFTAENTYTRRSGGRRQCRACNREAVARYRSRKRGVA